MRNALILLLCCSCIHAKAATYVSGIISVNTTWTKANSPYIVNGNLSVDSAITLTVEPGVTVLVDSGHYFIVNGGLTAEGTVTDTIKFTANSTNPTRSSWRGITFSTKAQKDTASIKYCLFENGLAAILNSGTYLHLYNSVFRQNTIAVWVNIALPSLISYHPENYITQCLFTKNNKGIFYATTSAYWTDGDIRYNTFSYNDTGYHDESDMGLEVEQNNFDYNGIGLCKNGDQHSVAENTFKGNMRYGIYWGAAQPVSGGSIRENTFMYNPVAVYTDNINTTNIYYNKFGYNGVGVDVHYTYTNSLTYLYSYKVWNNCFTGISFYNVKNNTDKDFIAQGNWWGTNNTTGIEATIYDSLDNPALGRVSYPSFELSSSGCPSIPPPPPCAQPDSVTIETTMQTTTVTVTWPKVAGTPAYEYYVAQLPAAPPTSGTMTQDTSINLTGLTAGHTYSVCVRARCLSAPFASAWVCDTVVIPYPPCDSPTNVDATMLTPTSARFSWDTVAGITEYEYYILPHPSTPPTNPTTTTSHMILLTGLSQDMVYDVCVRCKCSGNRYSAWSCDTLYAPTEINSTSDKNSMHLYPNPSNGTFTLQLANTNFKNASVQVYDVMGRVVYQSAITKQESQIILNAAKGIYMVKLQLDNEVVTKRVIVE